MVDHVATGHCMACPSPGFSESVYSYENEGLADCTKHPAFTPTNGNRSEAATDYGADSPEGHGSPMLKEVCSGNRRR